MITSVPVPLVSFPGESRFERLIRINKSPSLSEKGSSGGILGTLLAMRPFTGRAEGDGVFATSFNAFIEYVRDIRFSRSYIAFQNYCDVASTAQGLVSLRSSVDLGAISLAQSRLVEVLSNTISSASSTAIAKLPAGTVSHYFWVTSSGIGAIASFAKAFFTVLEFRASHSFLHRVNSGISAKETLQGIYNEIETSTTPSFSPAEPAAIPIVDEVPVAGGTLRDAARKHCDEKIKEETAVKQRLERAAKLSSRRSITVLIEAWEDIQDPSQASHAETRAAQVLALIRYDIRLQQAIRVATIGTCVLTGVVFCAALLRIPGSTRMISVTAIGNLGVVVAVKAKGFVEVASDTLASRILQVPVVLPTAS